MDGVQITPFSTTAHGSEHGCVCARAVLKGLGVVGTFALQASSSEDEEESEVVVCVLDVLEFAEGFLDMGFLLASP